MLQKFILHILIIGCLFTNLSYAKSEGSINYKNVAESETKVWQSYYNKNPVTLLINLTNYIQDLYGIENKITATIVATKFTFAYLKFGKTAQDADQKEYDDSVLPSLTAAYQTLKDSTNASWNSNEVAAADLSWMIARRNIKTLEPEKVANKMADFWYQQYGKNDHQHFIKASYLRAVAARYRDQCQDAWGGIHLEDWKMITAMLEQAYYEFSLGVFHDGR